MSPFAHPAFFYRGENEYVATLLPFVRAGVEAGEPVAVALPTENLRLIRAGVVGLDPHHALPVRFVDMTLAGLNPGRIIPPDSPLLRRRPALPAPPHRRCRPTGPEAADCSW